VSVETQGQSDVMIGGMSFRFVHDVAIHLISPRRWLRKRLAELEAERSSVDLREIDRKVPWHELDMVGREIKPPVLFLATSTAMGWAGCAHRPGLAGGGCIDSNLVCSTRLDRAWWPPSEPEIALGRVDLARLLDRWLLALLAGRTEFLVADLVGGT
jgi:hypothetical protein